MAVPDIIYNKITLPNFVVLDYALPFLKLYRKCSNYFSFILACYQIKDKLLLTS
jgi:hypothetical protein